MRLRKILRLAKGFPVLYMGAVVLTVVHQWTYSNVPLFMQYLIKTLINRPNINIGNIAVGEVHLPLFLIRFYNNSSTIMEVVYKVAFSLLLLQVIRFSLRFVESWIKGMLHENVGEKTRLKLYNHIQNLSYEFHNNVDTGDLIQRVTSDIETTTSFLTTRILDFVYLLATLFFGIYQLIRINQTMVFITLLVIPFTATASIFYFKKIEKMFVDIEETEEDMINTIQENLAGLKVVRAFANEAYELKKMETKNAKYRNKQQAEIKVSAKFWAFMDFIAINQYLVIIAIGIYAVQKNTIDAADIIASLTLIGMLIWPIRGLGRLISDFGKALVASDRLYEILDEPDEYLNNGTLKPNIEGQIEFKNVSFKFNDTSEHLLKGVNFTINKNETVAIIGKTGSGKSTIINLLLRMHNYQEGSILLDNVDLKDIEKRYLRKNIGVVLQDPFLYSKTVYENISITNRTAKYDQIVQAAQIAALEADIQTFKQGYETLVGEKGTTLSGGQKQRVAIARILIANKKIIIFDDALSAIDTRTDTLIREALKKKTEDQTTIIITHRITTAKEADKIIVLDKGLIEAVGTHEELANEEGLYKKLWDIQGKLEEEFINIIKEGEKYA